MSSLGKVFKPRIVQRRRILPGHVDFARAPEVRHKSHCGGRIGMFAIVTFLALPPILIGLAVVNTLRPALGFHRVPDRAFRPNIGQLMAVMGLIGLVCFWNSSERSIGYEKTKEAWIVGLDVTFLLIALGLVVVRRRSVFGWLGRTFLISIPFALVILAVGLNGL
jgi:hypothetical protein